ncbi:MAG TPA: dihydrolipoyl dehydrogenase [Urbifossiella sp.]|nr:dihydrolipoyl dehydrogenase [Urbifossiella sp.]
MFDLIVIGAGPGGYTAAIRAAQLKMKVACIDKRPGPALGGTCLNVGCIPSKALLDSSELFETTQNKLKKHGILVGPAKLDLAALLARKDKVVKELTAGVAYLFKKYGVTPVYGAAKLLAGNKVQVAGPDGKLSTLEGKNILLATGSESTELPFLKFDGQRIVSSTEALNFNPVPKHLIVVGAGYIGLELGSVWKRLGSKVTVIEFLPRILALSDGEIAGEAFKLLGKQGLEFHLETRVTGAKVQGDSVTVAAQAKDGKELKFTGDRVLVCVGRRPYIDGLGLEEAGVKFDPKTRQVPIDENYRTNVPGVFAIGDLVAGPMLAHKASEEGVVCVERLAGMKPHVNYDAIPSVIYTWPEMASVGQTEEQVKASGVECRVGRFKFAASGRAKAMDEQDGFVKVLADAMTDRVLGVHILGPRASDLIAECVTIMEYHGSAEDIARCTHAHPTLGEAVGEAARMAWTGSPLNS